MINEDPNILIEAYLIKSNKVRKGLVILSDGESVIVPVQQLRFFNIPDFYLN